MPGRRIPFLPDLNAYSNAGSFGNASSPNGNRYPLSDRYAFPAPTYKYVIGNVNPNLAGNAIPYANDYPDSHANPDLDTQLDCHRNPSHGNPDSLSDANAIWFGDSNLYAYPLCDGNVR